MCLRDCKQPAQSLKYLFSIPLEKQFACLCLDQALTLVLVSFNPGFRAPGRSVAKQCVRWVQAWCVGCWGPSEARVST